MRLHLLALPIVLGLATCAAQPGANTPPGASTDSIGTPAPGSKFFRVRIGMSKTEIQDLIGPPTDQYAHMTGKVAIPFYFGGDTTEIEAHYKGEGVLLYASKSVGSTSYDLIGIQVNTADTGYVH